MQYGYFDNESREYVIDRVDLPASWTNHLGVKDMCAVVSHTTDGYLFYKSSEYHRITRFRGNGMPMDRPSHYVYVRDDETREYWFIFWQPVGKGLSQAKYICRHGLSYSRYECSYQGIEASQALSISREDAVELWDVKLRNSSDRERHLSVYSYCELSFHHIEFDNKNFQISLYAVGSSYEDGIIEYDLFYEEFGYQYFTMNQEPDGYDCLWDTFPGEYRTESNPIVVEGGKCRDSFEKGGNHCGILQKTMTLKPGEGSRVTYLLGEGNREAGKAMREKYKNPEAVDRAYGELREFQSDKLKKLQIHTPDEGMNTLINTWTLYQSKINVMFSRFASFIEVGGRTGLGYRDTAQDAMTVPHSNPEKYRSHLVELLRGLVSRGYDLHLFQPKWFDPKVEVKPFKPPTVVPTPKLSGMIRGLEDTCSDDVLWLVASVVEYVKETGEDELFDEVITYADGGSGTVYEHTKRTLDFFAEQVGDHGTCKGPRADWNDCLNLGGGESVLVSFLHYWAIQNFLEATEYLHREDDVKTYTEVLQGVREACDRELWDGEWYIQGITKNGRRIGTQSSKEGRIRLESNSWAVLSGTADEEKDRKAMDAVDEYLYTPYGIMLNGPSYMEPDDDIGFVTRVYPGVKESGSIFSHSNPWAWATEYKPGWGDRAMKFYDALYPYYQNDKIEIRQAEPYSYRQFIMGKDHMAYGRARHPFMTGSGGWAYFPATRYIPGIRPQFGTLEIDPCVPADWKEFEVQRVWRGADFRIEMENPDGVIKGVKELYLDGELVKEIPAREAGSTNEIRVVMG